MTSSAVPNSHAKAMDEITKRFHTIKILQRIKNIDCCNMLTNNRQVSHSLKSNGKISGWNIKFSNGIAIHLGHLFKPKNTKSKIGLKYQNQNEITNRFHIIKRLQRIKRFRGDWQRRSRQAAHSLKSSEVNYRIFKWHCHTFGTSFRTKEHKIKNKLQNIKWLQRTKILSLKSKFVNSILVAEFLGEKAYFHMAFKCVANTRRRNIKTKKKSQIVSIQSKDYRE